MRLFNKSIDYAFVLSKSRRLANNFRAGEDEGPSGTCLISGVGYHKAWIGDVTAKFRRSKPVPFPFLIFAGLAVKIEVLENSSSRSKGSNKS